MKPYYIIIGGTSKAGTTSIFDYLAAHPNVAPSYIKQTLFFLDNEWQKKLTSNSLYDFEKGLDQYDQYFDPTNEQKYRLEASPDYLYAPNTPLRIYNFLKNREGKIIFVLRKPSDRMSSYFYFGKQQGLIPQDMDFMTYYNITKNYEEDENICLMAYKTGFYSKYLQKYIDIFGKKRLSVFFFEDLKVNAQRFMKDMAQDLQIDETFYDTYGFKVKNKTIQVRSSLLRNIYNKLRAIYLDHFYRTKMGVLVGQLIKNTATKAYRKANFEPLEKKEIDLNILKEIEKAYDEEKQRLEKLLDRKIPW